MMNKKIYFIRSLSIVFYFIFIIILIWIYFGVLQLFYFDYYAKKSISNFIRYTNIESIRGSILDCKNKIIVTTKPVLRLNWIKDIKKLSEMDYSLIKFLKNVVNIDINDEKLFEKNQDIKFLIKDNISFEELSIILENFPNSKRISVEIYPKRFYPNLNMACHIIGYLNAIDNIGLTGIESLYNNILEGESGTKKIIINSRGNILESEVISNAKEGKNIKTTIDIDLQKSIEAAIPVNERGCAIVMDPETGAIKAILSLPNFHPEIFLRTISQEEWMNLIENKALLNRCFQAVYPPGSIFKIITTITILEEKIIDESKEWLCNGGFEYKGRNYRCHLKKGHGLINLRNAILHSCNIPFFWVSIAGLSIDKIYKYAKLFGLGEKTGIQFNELEGLIPNTKWKKKVFNERWYLGETLSVSIGQGATLVTPIQIARLMAGVMTGFLVSPRILENMPIIKKEIQVKNETLNFVKEALFMATKFGSSNQLKKLYNWEICAKTGTSQVCSLPQYKENEEKIVFKEKNKNHHGLIACYARHKNKKVSPFVLVIAIENNGSSAITVGYAKKFFEIYEKMIS
jgi:penicillin-binding protein 2